MASIPDPLGSERGNDFAFGNLGSLGTAPRVFIFTSKGNESWEAEQQDQGK
jgi:hypothetical protein